MSNRKLGIVAGLMWLAAGCASPPPAQTPRPPAPAPPIAQTPPPPTPAPPIAKPAPPAERDAIWPWVQALKTLAEPSIDPEAERPRSPRVAVSPLLDATLGIEGPLGRWLADRLALAMNSAGLSEVSREDLDRTLGEQRLNSSASFDERTAAELGRLVGAEALLLGRYYPAGAGVEVHLRWIEVKSAATRRVAVTVPPQDLPDFKPPDNAQQARAWHTALAAESAPTPDAFRVELWPARGPGGVYRVGELMTVKLRATVDCHLRLYHVSVAGAVTQLFPNRFQTDDHLQGGQIVTLGGPGAPYQWTVSEPAGVEYLKAVASTAPFEAEPPLPGGDFASLGRADALDLGTLRTRGLKVEGRTAEAICGVEVLR